MLSRLMTTREQFVLVGSGAAVLVGVLALYVHDHVTTHPENPRPSVTVTAPVQNPELPVAPVQTLRTEPQPAPPGDTLSPHPETITVSLVGAVQRPGLYELRPDARIQDLVSTAGGVMPEADVSDINLAARLIDGTTLWVPRGPVANAEGGKLVMRRGESAAHFNLPEYTLSAQRSYARTQAEPPTAAGVPAAAAGPPNVAQKRLIDLNRATADELESLPGIGSVLAGEIIRTREQAPFRTVDDVTRVKGIGAKRLEAIRAYVTVR